MNLLVIRLLWVMGIAVICGLAANLLKVDVGIVLTGWALSEIACLKFPEE